MVESLKGCVESYLVPSVEEMLAICTNKFSFFSSFYDYML